MNHWPFIDNQLPLPPVFMLKYIFVLNIMSSAITVGSLPYSVIPRGGCCDVVPCK